LVEPLGVSGWLAFRPAARQETAKLMVALVEEMDTLFSQYPIDAIYSSEPRSYRRTPRGRRALARAIEDDRVERLTWATPSRGPGGPGRTGLADAQCLLTFPSKRFSQTVGSVSIVIQPNVQSAYLSLTQVVTSVLTQWFEPLGAVSAFVSHYGMVEGGEIGDHPLITRHERQSGIVLGPHAVERYLRGVFWAMGLGAQLCSYLGGQEAVLRNAPVARALSTGSGVWLLASDEPPGSRNDFVRLATYLAPLIGTANDIRAVETVADAGDTGQINWRQSEYAASEELAAVLEEAAALPSRELSTNMPVQKRVPIRGLRALLDLEADAALNLYLERPPTRPQLVRLVATMQAWYEQGVTGGFGGAGFHSLEGPTVDGRVVRWNADLGSADSERAIHSLATQLAVLPDVNVTQLVIGTNSTG
jgi:hypothetical protein